MTAQIPINVLRIESILQSHGPMTLDDLSAALAAEGIALNAERLKATADRFAEHLFLTDQGLIDVSSSWDRHDEARSQTPPTTNPSLEASRGANQHPSGDAQVPIAWDTVLVIDLSRDRANSPKILSAVVGRHSSRWPANTPQELADALRALSVFAREYGAIAMAGWQNHSHHALAAAADDLTDCLELAQLWRLPYADVALLSVLADPTLAQRDLNDTSLGSGPEHKQNSRAQTISDLAAAIMDQIDASEPSWALAINALATSGNIWGRILPRVLAPRPHDTLVCARDPLLQRADGIEAFTTARGVEVLAREFPNKLGKSMRPQQLEMALAVAEAIDDSSDLVVEAPTGTGKTLAYLAPASVRGSTKSRATVVATHTKVLQRQIRAEVQALRDAGLFAPPFRQLFGVSNYICTREVAETLATLGQHQVGDLTTADKDPHAAELGAAVAVAVRALALSQNGVWDDVTDMAIRKSSVEYGLARSRMATDPAECEHKDCTWAKECPMMQRRTGMEDDPGLISTNHAVVATWAANPEAVPVGILGPESSAVLVFDEAHRLEDSVTSAWTKTTGLSPLAALFFDLSRSRGRVGRCQRDLKADGIPTQALEELMKQMSLGRAAVHDLEQAVHAYVHEYAARDERIELRRGVVDARPEYARIRNAGLRVNRMLATAMDLLGEMDTAIVEASAGSGSTPVRRRSWRTLKSLHRRSKEQRDLISALVDLKDGHAFVHLLVAHAAENDEPADWTFERIPIEIADAFHSLVQKNVSSLILTSATMRVGGSFDFIIQRLGLELRDQQPDDSADAPEQDATTAVRTLALTSPFDFDRQSLVVMTTHLPVPIPAHEDEFCEAAAAESIGFLSLSRGRTLTLFAARSRMEKVVEGVRTRETELAERGVSLLAQGQNAPSEIQTRFLREEGTALFGLQSYWEGFDAPGRTLSFVQIEKAPYPPPSDPLISARSRSVSARGGDPFLDYVVPRTAITLAQGFGRLIRGPEDRGVAFLFDRRLQHPSMANDILLGTLPTTNLHIAMDRNDSWTTALSFVDGVEPDLTTALDAPASAVMEALERLALDFDQPLEPQLQSAALELFGIRQLLPEQLELMLATLTGQDAIGILPTGTGKSLTFQLPAVLRADGRPTVVISPLVALIKDQVDDLRARRGLRVVAGITGRTSGAERTELLRDMTAGHIRLLYVAPERLASDMALRTALSSRNLGALVVDEAHCISSWGHDFRPEFRQIARSVRDFHVDATLALTATATPEVEGDIVASLQMSEPVVVRRAVTRPDLRYTVIKVNSDRERIREILRVHEADRKASGLVYVTRRALADEVAWLLRQAGISARSYHAGMDPGQRESVQDDFLDGSTQVVVATKAFGMGVNKPDIAWVVHYDAPESLEAYVQEAGRAARDSDLTGDAVLLVGRGDLVRHRKMLGIDSDEDRLRRATNVWNELSRLEKSQHGEVEFDPETVAEACKQTTEEVATALGWLEQTGHLARRPDTAVAGMVAPGRGEPTDADDRGVFRRLTLEHLRIRAGQRRRIDDMHELAGSLGVGSIWLERALIEWTMRRYLTFQPTQKRWRAQFLKNQLEPMTLTRLLKDWRRSQHRRLDDLQAYAEPPQELAECRRVLVARTFGDTEQSCASLPHAQSCDVCSQERPAWHQVPLERVPDPERLVDIEVVVLQAVRWATEYTKGRYGESGLMLAILGEDQYPGGRPLSAGLMSCPQFGSLKYLRGAQRRLRVQVDQMVNAGLLERETSDRNEASYTSLLLTDTGRRVLNGEVAA